MGKVWVGVITLPLIPSHPRLRRIFDKGGETSSWTACLVNHSNVWYAASGGRSRKFLFALRLEKFSERW
jgi:hypothetical protein